MLDSGRIYIYTRPDPLSFLRLWRGSALGFSNHHFLRQFCLREPMPSVMAQWKWQQTNNYSHIHCTVYICIRHLFCESKSFRFGRRTDKCTSMKWFDSHTQAWEKDGSKFYIHLTSSLQHLVGDPQLEELEHEGIVARVLWWYRGIQGIL